LFSGAKGDLIVRDKMAAAARTPKYMYKTAPGNSGELSIEYGTDLGALTRLEVSNGSAPGADAFLFILWPESGRG
jgi:hypothetical protein